jgi:hypothetical protein
VLGPGSGDATFCGVVLYIALRRGNPEKQLARRAARDRFVAISVFDRHLRGLDDVMCSGKED